MHCCGNPIHDIPQFLPLLAPALTGLAMWLRSRFGKKCECGEHSEDHEHA